MVSGNTLQLAVTAFEKSLTHSDISKLFYSAECPEADPGEGVGINKTRRFHALIKALVAKHRRNSRPAWGEFLHLALCMIESKYETALSDFWSKNQLLQGQLNKDGFPLDSFRTDGAPSQFRLDFEDGLPVAVARGEPSSWSAVSSSLGTSTQDSHLPTAPPSQRSDLQSPPKNGVHMPGNRVFIVHGHDNEMKEAVARFVQQLGLEPIILHERSSKGMTLIEKLEHYADVAFAVVLLSPDDVGTAVSGGAPAARARQNVVFELGYFYGRLKRERVCTLRRGPVELHSDISGVVWTDWGGDWRTELARELRDAGFTFSADALLGSR